MYTSSCSENFNLIRCVPDLIQCSFEFAAYRISCWGVLVLKIKNNVSCMLGKADPTKA